jgi:hypothetical protein
VSSRPTVTLYSRVPVTTARAVGDVVEVPDDPEGLLDWLLDQGLDDPDAPKGAAGYVVAAPVPGPRSNAAAQPTRLLALDYDDLPPGQGPDWAALAPYRYAAYTTDSHDPDGPAGERWRVWVWLDRAYSREEVSAAECPWVGCHLRAISQPVYLPTKVSSVEWRTSAPGARALRLGAEWGAAAAPAQPAPEPAPPTRRAGRVLPSQASTNALVTRWLSRPEGTNRLAGATGAALAEWGWTDEEIVEYLTAWLGEADPKFRKHLDDATRGARKRRAGDRIVGFPTLTEELGGPGFVADAPAGNDVDGLWAALSSGGAAEPVAEPGAPDDGWGFENGTAVAAWEAPPVPWVCEALCLAPGAPGLITGYGGSGKTTLVQHLALCVASGRPLLGVHPVRQGRVTHLDYEQGRDLTRRRYQQQGITDLPAEAQARLRFVSFPTTRLTSDDAAARLLRAAQGQTLLIVDSLIAASVLDDENAAAAREPLDLLGRVSEVTGCAVLVIHHSKKDRSNSRTSARGSSAITDAVSVHITYEKDDEAGVASPARLGLQKVRHILPVGAALEGFLVGQSSAGVLSIVEEPDVLERLAPLAAEVVEALKAGPSTVTELAQELRKRKADLVTVTNAMAQNGIIVKDIRGLSLP